MRVLSLEVLEEASVALFAGVPIPTTPLTADALIPFLEWNWLRGSGHSLPEATTHGLLARFQKAAGEGHVAWRDGPDARCGFLRVRRAHADAEASAWLRFLDDFGRAAKNAGLSNAVAQRFTAVVGELEDNVHWHSDHPQTGRLAFLAHEGSFEFVVYDRGIGVLESLRRNPEFSDLRDAGEALSAATTTGYSRFGKASGRGWGFHDLMVGIVNSNASIRFRSGDHLLELDGTSAEVPTSRLAQRAAAPGLMTAVRVVA